MGDVVLKLTAEQAEALRKGESIEFTDDQLAELSGDKKVDAPNPEAVKANEETIRRLTEVEGRNKTLEGDLKKATEEVAAIRREAKRMEMTEFVRTNRLAFQGEVEANVDRLERMQASLSAEDYQAVLDERKELHARVKDSDLFKQVGDPTNRKAATEFEGLVAVKVAAGLTEPDAITKAAAERPDLYKRYDEERNVHIKRGGD